MASINRVILAGNLTRDPEARRLPSGMMVCNLGLAINRRYRNTRTGEIVDETTYVDIDVWGNQAGFCRDYLRRGSPVLVEGRLRMDTWDDKNTGAKRSRLVVVAERVQSLAARSASSGPEVEEGTEEGTNFRPTWQEGGKNNSKTSNLKPSTEEIESVIPPSDETFDPEADSVDDIPF